IVLIGLRWTRAARAYILDGKLDPPRAQRRGYLRAPRDERGVNIDSLDIGVGKPAAQPEGHLPSATPRLQDALDPANMPQRAGQVPAAQPHAEMQLAEPAGRGRLKTRLAGEVLLIAKRREQWH